jgi:hypothetical protein
VTTSEIDEDTRRDAFVLSASVACGDLSTKEFVRSTRWLEDPERIHKLMKILKVLSLSQPSTFMFESLGRHLGVPDVRILLVLYPQDGDESLIRCRVHKVPRWYVPSYEAICCSWGRSLCMKKIFLNDRPFDVPFDGFQTLRNFREGKTAVRLIWLDAICIKQPQDSRKSLSTDHHDHLLSGMYQGAERVIVYLVGKPDNEEQRLQSVGGFETGLGGNSSFVPASTSGYCSEDYLTALERFFSEQRWCQIIATFLSARDVVFFYGSYELSLGGIRDSLIRSGPFELTLDDIQEILDHPQHSERDNWPNSEEIGELLGLSGLSVNDISELVNRPRYPHERTCSGDVDKSRLQKGRARILLESGMTQPTTVELALNHLDPHTGHVKLNRRLREDVLGRARAVVDFLYHRKERVATLV